MPLAYIAVILNSVFVLGFVALMFIDFENLFSFLFYTFWQIPMPFVFVFTFAVLLIIIAGIALFFLQRKNVGKILMNIANGLAMLLCVFGALGLVIAIGVNWSELSIFLVLYALFGASLGLLNLDKTTFIKVEA